MQWLTPPARRTVDPMAIKPAKKVPARAKQQPPVVAIVLDTETTGLLKHPAAKKELQPRIIEFGAVLIDSRGRELDSYDVLIFPDQEIDDEITSITGITNEQLNGAPRFPAVFKKIKKMIEKATVMIAHNLPFDKGMLLRELTLMNAEVTWPRYALCTVQENVHVYGHRVKLKDLYKDVIGKPLAQKHRALDDCRALAEIVTREKYLDSFVAR